METGKQVVIITGASSGIGEATARLFAQRGYRVALAARSTEKLAALENEIRARDGEALAIPTDVLEPESIDNLIRTTLENWGQVDILFNNAGVGKFGWLENLDPIKDIQEQIGVNLLGTILASRAVLPAMIARKNGHIINMASISGLVGIPTYTIYAASKFGLRGFSQALRREVKAWGIHVSTVFPGGVETDFAAKSGSVRKKAGISTPDWMRIKAPDVARAILRLARRPKSIVVLPWMMRYSVWLNNMAPSLVDRISTERFVKPERGL